MNEKIMVNVGCGNIYHEDWINLDIFTSKNVKYHNIKKKSLPFKDNSVDVIYHSHILEHLEKERAKIFINDCYRVLKPDGIMRIAVPDLEAICVEYLNNLKTAFEDEDNENAKLNYEWIKIEMLDQIVRKRRGGEMAQITSGEPLNKSYIEKRNGNIFFNKENAKNNRIKKIIYLLKNFKIKQIISYVRILLAEDEAKLTGEKHYWNYDRLDLKLLLLNNGFKDFQIKKYNESKISNWSGYKLDEDRNGKIRKPSSIFVEVCR